MPLLSTTGCLTMIETKIEIYAQARIQVGWGGFLLMRLDHFKNVFPKFPSYFLGHFQN